jgi:hypothetical protein
MEAGFARVGAVGRGLTPDVSELFLMHIIYDLWLFMGLW